jgi:hypothetical protein
LVAVAEDEPHHNMVNSVTAVKKNVSTVVNSVYTVLKTIFSRYGEGHGKPYRTLRHCLVVSSGGETGYRIWNKNKQSVFSNSSLLHVINIGLRGFFFLYPTLKHAISVSSEALKIHYL